MRVYLAGPMTGYPQWNFPAFEAACVSLRRRGYTVISPHEHDLDDGFDPTGDGAGFDLRAALEWDLLQVHDTDGVVLLPGWEASCGTIIEVTTAHALGRVVLTLDEALLRVS